MKDNVTDNLLYLPQHGFNSYQPVNKPIELYLEWLSNQGPQSKYEYSTLCQGHSKLPIHTAPCLPQFPQQPITIAMESRETIATLRPWMLLAGSMEWKKKETEVKFKEKPTESMQLPKLPPSCEDLTVSLLMNLLWAQIDTVLMAHWLDAAHKVPIYCLKFYWVICLCVSLSLPQNVLQ